MNNILDFAITSADNKEVLIDFVKQAELFGWKFQNSFNETESFEETLKRYDSVYFNMTETDPEDIALLKQYHYWASEVCDSPEVVIFNLDNNKQHKKANDYLQNVIGEIKWTKN